MPRKGENIYKRKDGRWEGRYIKGHSGGKAQYGAVYAGSYRETKKKLDEAKKALENKPCAARAGNMADIGQRWLSDMSATLKESSVNKYDDLLRCYILPVFGEYEFSEITNQNIIDFTSALLSNGGVEQQGLAPSTVAEVLSTLNSIRIYALKRNCAVAFSPECVSIKREQKDIRVFSLEEQNCLLEHLRENMNPSALGILVCFFTGIRIGELCALNWDDFNLPEKKVRIRRTMQRLRVDDPGGHKTAVRIFEPKSTCSMRTIPISAAIMELLEKYYTQGTFLLTCKHEKFIEPRTMQNRFKSILRSCNIFDANFHAIRHTFATRCIEVGFDVKSLSEILGHASVEITLNRYVHPSMDLKTANMKRLSDLFTVK